MDTCAFRPHVQSRIFTILLFGVIASGFGFFLTLNLLDRLDLSNIYTHLHLHFAYLTAHIVTH